MSNPTITRNLCAWGRWVVMQNRVKGYKPAWWVRLMDRDPEYVESRYDTTAYDDDIVFMDRAINKLTPEQRRIVALTYVECKRAEIVGNEIGLSRATVFRRLDEIHARLEYLLAKSFLLDLQPFT